MAPMKSRTLMRSLALALFVASAACTTAWSQTASANATAVKTYEIDVPGTKEWVDTNIDVRGGAKLRFPATGQVTYPADQSYSGKTRSSGTFGPDGLSRGFADLLHQYAVGDAGHGALIGRVGPDTYAQAFLVGASKEYVVPVAGRLFVGLNQSMSEAATANGGFHVKIEVLDESSKDAAN